MHSSTYFLRLVATGTILSAETTVSTLFFLTASFTFPLWRDQYLATSCSTRSPSFSKAKMAAFEDGGLDALGDRGVLQVLDEAAADERLALDHVRGGVFHREE